MNVINYFDSERKQHWQKEISKCDWGAGKFLLQLICNGTFFDAVGAGSKLLLLIEGDSLISFCTYAVKDDIQPTELSPWMGFVYTFPQYRGNRYVGKLFEAIEQIAKAEEVDTVYISTNHNGLYEKYGCTFLTQMIDMEGEPTGVYAKKI